MNPITLFLSAVLALAGFGIGARVNAAAGGVVIAVALLVFLSLKMANTWQKFVILRAGKLQA